MRDKMVLSDKKDIQELLEEAKQHKARAIKSSKDYVSCLVKVLACYNQIIDNAHPHPYYFNLRSDAKYSLSAASHEYDLITSAIEDITNAIALAPDNATYYWKRANLRLIMIRDIANAPPDVFMPIIKDYNTSIRKDPLYSRPWIDLMAVNLALRNWDETISLYGQCKTYIKDKEEQLYRSYFGCLALIVVGEHLEEEDTMHLYGSFQDNYAGGFERDRLAVASLKVIQSMDLPKDEQETLNHISELFIAHFKHKRQGIFFFQMGYPEKAIHAFDKSLKSSPDDPLLYYNKASCLVNLMNYEEALKAYNKAIELRPEETYYWYQKGMCLFIAGSRDEAAEALEEAISLKPDDLDAWALKAACFFVSGQSEKAIETYERLIEMNPYSTAVWHLWGSFLVDALHHSEDALAVYNKILQLTPQDIRAMRHKCGCLKDLGRYEEAIEVYDEILKMNPEDDIAWEAKGDCLGFLCRYDEAIRAYERAIPPLKKICQDKPRHSRYLKGCLEKMENVRKKQQDSAPSAPGKKVQHNTTKQEN